MTRALPAALALSAVLLAAPAAPAVPDTLNGFDLSDPLVPRELIRRGGVERDGIPSIDAPQFTDAEQATHVTDTDRVMGVVLGEIAKAYPIKILNYHEIVNDRFGAAPVAVTFCPLCNSGIVFDARVADTPRQFGVSGLLYNSDVLMYDRQSESLWSQILGQAVAGAERGARLSSLPARHTTWADWRRRHPDTLVLEAPEGSATDYNIDPYFGYAESSVLIAPVAHQDDRYHSKEVVIGVVVNEQAYAWPLSELPSEREFIVDTVAGQTLRAEYDLSTQSARVLDVDGVEIPSFTAFWFAWVAFHPETGVYRGDAER